MKLIALCVTLAVVFSQGEAAGFGAPSPTNVNNAGVEGAAKFATSVISEGYGGPNELGLLRVIKATHQVVAGALYTLTIAAGRTNCLKGSHSKGLCSIPKGADSSNDVDYNVCEVSVWDKSWETPRYKITKLKCSKPNKNEVV